MATTVILTVRIEVDSDDDTTVQEIVNEMDYNFSFKEKETEKILDTEITDFDIGGLEDED